MERNFPAARRTISSGWAGNSNELLVEKLSRFRDEREFLLADMRTGKLKRIPAPGLHSKSLAVDGNGIVFAWDGKSRILTIDPREPQPRWRYFDWTGAGPAAGFRRVYSKWQYVAGADVFVGLSTRATGVWVYKHPEAMPGVELAAIDPQQIINESGSASVVTIPPGLYGQGITIDKSLTVRLKDAHLRGVARNKAIINVRCNGCNVVIEDFHGDGREAGCLDRNCAGIKAEGDTFRLTYAGPGSTTP